MTTAKPAFRPKRFIVTDKVYDAFVVAFVTQMKDISMGDLTDENTQLGPLSSQDQFDTAKGQVEGSVAKGAKVLCGGNVPDRKGAYYPATVLGDVAPGIPAYDDEIFGPVAAVIRAEDEGDAMRIAATRTQSRITVCAATRSTCRPLIMRAFSIRSLNQF